MDEKTVEEAVDNINKGIQNLQETVKNKADSANVEELKNNYEELKNKIGELASQEKLTKQQEQLDDISTKLKKLGEQQGQPVKSKMQVIDENLQSEDFQKAVKNAAEGNSPGQIASFSLKALGDPLQKDVTTSNINSGSIRTQYEPGVAKHPWKQTPFFDAVPKGTIGDGRDSVSWWEESSRTDNTEMVAETGAASAQSAAQWTKKSLDITHVTAYTKVSRSALEDWDFTRGELTDLLNNQLPRKVEDQIINGDGSGQNLLGIITQAKSFAKPDNFATVSDPNYIDAHRAVMTQIMNGDTSDNNKKGYMPNMSFVNQGDLMNIRGMKDANGSYIIPPLGEGITDIDGVRLSPSLDLPGDDFVVCDMSQGKLYIKRNMEIQFLYETGTDALNDLVTILIRMRLSKGVKIATPHKFAFVNGTWSNVKTAIQESTA